MARGRTGGGPEGREEEGEGVGWGGRIAGRGTRGVLRALRGGRERLCMSV